MVIIKDTHKMKPQLNLHIYTYKEQKANSIIGVYYITPDRNGTPQGKKLT